MIDRKEIVTHALTAVIGGLIVALGGALVFTFRESVRSDVQAQALKDAQVDLGKIKEISTRATVFGESLGKSSEEVAGLLTEIRKNQNQATKAAATITTLVENRTNEVVAGLAKNQAFVDQVVASFPAVATSTELHEQLARRDMRLSSLESATAFCEAWAVITARGPADQGYPPTQRGRGPVPYYGSDSTIESVTRTDTGRYEVKLKTTVDSAKHVVISASVRGYDVRIAASSNLITIVVRENNPVDDIVYLLLFKQRSMP